jgi:hypothetical protein
MRARLSFIWNFAFRSPLPPTNGPCESRAAFRKAYQLLVRSEWMVGYSSEAACTDGPRTAMEEWRVNRP